MNRKFEALSPDDLQHVWSKLNGNWLPVIIYDEIEASNDINQLFDVSDVVVVFYPLAENGSWGHYVALVRHPKTIYYYDSYGYKPDGIRKFADDDDMYHEDPRQHSLIRLLLDSPYKCDFSHYRHQDRKNEAIATCGRHAILRCLNGYLTNNQYHKHLSKLKQQLKMGFDDVVSELIH